MLKHRYFRYFINIILVLLAVFILFVICHQAKNRIEMTQCKKIFGDNLKVIDVDGKKMSCYESGSGRDTIVLLSAIGTPSPIADFMPLTAELSKKHKVIVLEYFGYGFSDSTNRLRSNENFVSEIRAALKNLKATPPYILMPHSFSGIYAMVLC